MEILLVSFDYSDHGEETPLEQFFDEAFFYPLFKIGMRKNPYPTPICASLKNYQKSIAEHVIACLPRLLKLIKSPKTKNQFLRSVTELKTDSLFHGIASLMAKHE
jgi:hypothetical protein